MEHILKTHTDSAGVAKSLSERGLMTAYTISIYIPN